MRNVRVGIFFGHESMVLILNVTKTSDIDKPQQVIVLNENVKVLVRHHLKTISTASPTTRVFNFTSQLYRRVFKEETGNVRSIVFFDSERFLIMINTECGI
jgi:hypothetical protein